MSKAGTVALTALSVLYPCLVFVGLVRFGVQPRVLALCMAVIGLLLFLSVTGSRRAGKADRARRFAVSAVVGVLAVAIAVSNSGVLLKLYPVVMTGSFLASFVFTLVRPPSMIERFARLQDKSLAEREDYPFIARYCRTVTVVWCVFFACNIAISLYTAFRASDLAWSVYNGLISYVLIGILFVGEMIVRRFVRGTR